MKTHVLGFFFSIEISVVRFGRLARRRSHREIIANYRDFFDQILENRMDYEDSLEDLQDDDEIEQDFDLGPSAEFLERFVEKIQDFIKTATQEDTKCCQLRCLNNARVPQSELNTAISNIRWQKSKGFCQWWSWVRTMCHCHY